MDYENRTELLKALPPNPVIAEVGVLLGHFAYYMVKACKPKTMYLIDVWEELPREEYSDFKPGYVNSGMMAKVEERMHKWIRRGIVHLLKGYSKDMAKEIPDESCDFVYIDADHTYDGCTADIKSYWPKVKPGGILAGHDYEDIDWPMTGGRRWIRAKWGVYSAVNDFFPSDKVHRIPYPTPNWWVQKD